MNHTTIPVPNGCGWNDKTSSRWRAGEFGTPPAKSRLLASDPNYLTLTRGHRPSDNQKVLCR